MATPIPKNHAAFSLPEVVLATGGECALVTPLVSARGVTSDSRAVVPGELFVALVGERFDGHDHVAAACERGAAIILASRDVSAPVPVVKVPDTLLALGALARAHRARWAAHDPRRRVIGVTGSAGKTTTRHAITALTSALGFAVHSSAGNLNNAIGVPMTLLGLTHEHELAVVEMGMNSPGEIAHVAAVTQPDIGLVTLVADAHTEGVGTVWDVLREKSALLAALAPTGMSICNVDDPLTAACSVKSGARTRVGYGQSEGAHVRITSRVGRGLDGSAIELEIALAERVSRLEAEIPLLGLAGALAAAAAVSAALAIDPSIPTADLARALPSIGGNEGGRLSAKTASDGTIVIDDAYNANPASMRSSIDAAAEIARSLGRPLVLVIGSMFELGARSAELHAEVGAQAAQSGARAIVVVGGEIADPMARAVEAAGAALTRAADAAGATAALRKDMPSGAVVLIKASHSVGLTAVAAALVAG